MKLKTMIAAIATGVMAFASFGLTIDELYNRWKTA